MAKKILSLVLALVMVLCLLPARASAEITEVTGGSNSFTDAADLKAVKAGTKDKWNYYYYTGEGPLTIAEDITVPNYVRLNVEDNQLVIPEGVTITIGENSYLVVGTLTVQGALKCYGSVDVYEELDITGSVYLDGHMSVEDGAALSGEDKVECADEYDQITMYHSVDTMDDLKAALELAEMRNSPHINHHVNAFFLEKNITLEESITIPFNADLNINAESFTIAEGATLKFSVKDYWDTNTIGCPLTINGTLSTNRHLVIDGGLTIGKNGMFEGIGNIGIYGETLEDAKAAFSSQNDRTYLFIDDYDSSWHTDGIILHGYIVKDVTGLTQLGTPTELAWGYGFSYRYNEELNTSEQVKIEAPGSVIFKVPELTQGHYAIKVYREGESSVYASRSIDYGAMDTPEWIDINLKNEDFESGAYYFTVVSEGDYTEYYSSEIAKSGTWTYTKPSAQVGKCTNLTWNWPEYSWEAPENYGGYETAIYFSPDLNGEPYQISSGIGSFYSDEYAEHMISSEVWDGLIQRKGIGYYYFKVRALSKDITQWCNGEWSELSEPYYMDTKPVSGQLQDVILSGASGDEILDAVQDMDTQELKDAMLAYNSDAVNSIMQLEEKVGGAAAVEVSKEAAAFAAGDISIVGANLNKSSADAAPAKLVVDKPEKDHILPAQYNNAVAVKFSMDLENVENTENLAVPVKVTLPVPEKMNPDFLVVLHYHADGSVEELRPYVYTEMGKTYASFVLTSFSDFTLTEYVGMSNPFNDVAEGTYYYNPVLWAVENGITTGVSENTFSPEGTCTRAQIVTFLWRANGSPKVVTANPFTDVPADQWYTDAVLWAIAEGITSGTSANTFSPDAPCTRGQVATFLWRSMGQQKASTGNIFSDIAPGAYYYDAVLWAVENGVTNGVGEGIFAPDATCTRGQIVTFLYRAMVK